MFLDKKYLLIIVSKLVLVFCYEHVYFNTKETKTFHIGYISGNRNKTTGKFDYYNLPGLKISAAMNLAVERINQENYLGTNVKLSYELAETYGLESESILQTAKLWRKDVNAIIGPQETCNHEARMAATFNLPMISHYCSNGATSDKRLYKTFARTRPPSTIVTKSLASLLLRFNWTRIAFFRPISSKHRLEVIESEAFHSKLENKSQMGLIPSKKYTPGGYEHIAVSMKKMFKELDIHVR